MNRGYIFIIFATLFFSSMEVVLKPIAHIFHPMQMNCTRFLVGGILLIPLAIRALRKRNISLTLHDWIEFAWLGFIGLTISMMLYQTSIMYIPASAVSVLFSCNPVLVVPLAFLIFHTEMKTYHCIALALEAIAAIIIINPFNIILNMTGVTLVLVSAATFALYAVLGRNQCMKFSGVAVTCFSSLAASVEMLLVMALSHWTPVANILTNCGLGLFANMPFIDGYTTENIWIVAYSSMVFNNQ